jgi:hypothetical protein
MKRKNPAAVALGRKGGAAATKAQKEAARRNLEAARALRWQRNEQGKAQR